MHVLITHSTMLLRFSGFVSFPNKLQTRGLVYLFVRTLDSHITWTHNAFRNYKAQKLTHYGRMLSVIVDLRCLGRKMENKHNLEAFSLMIKSFHNNCRESVLNSLFHFVNHSDLPKFV